MGTVLSTYRPLWTDTLLTKRRRTAVRRPRRISYGPTDAAAEREVLHPHQQGRPERRREAASLTEFVAALHERWAERVVSMYGLVMVFNFCGLTLSTAFDAPKILRRELLPYELFIVINF